MKKKTKNTENATISQNTRNLCAATRICVLQM